MEKSSVLVTGGSGFIGYNLIKRLKQDGHSVNTISRTYGHDHLEGLVEHMIPGDIRRYDVVEKAMRGVRYVFHLAGFQPGTAPTSEEMHTVAVEGTKNILTVANQRGVPRVVVASSVVVSGFSSKRQPLDIEGYVGNTDHLPYLRSKIAVERLVRQTNHPHVMIARPGKVYGAGDFAGKNTSILKQFERTIVPVLPGSGAYVSVDDCVDALILIAEKGMNQQTYTIAAEEIPLKEIYQHFKDATHADVHLLRVPRMLRYLANVPWVAEYMGPEKNEKAVYGFNSKVWNNQSLVDLGWSPKVPVKDAIIQAVQFYEQMDLWKPTGNRRSDPKDL